VTSFVAKQLISYNTNHF